MAHRDKMMFCPSDDLGSMYESLQASTIYWKEAGDGRADRMISRENLSTAKAIAFVYFGDVYLHFEYILLETGFDPKQLNSIRDPVFQELAQFGTYNQKALSLAIASVLKRTHSQKDFAQLVYELDVVYHDLLTQQYGETFSMQISEITNAEDLPLMIEGLLKLH